MPNEQEVLYEDKYMRVTKIPEYDGEPEIDLAFIKLNEQLERQREHDAQRTRPISVRELELLKKELQTMTAAVVVLTKKMDQFREILPGPSRRWYHKLFGIGNETK